METASPLNAPRTAKIAIIGGGFGALMAVGVLRFRGVSGQDITVYSESDGPERVWEKTVRAFRLTHMRSESLGHFYPTDSPGLATVEAATNWSLKPLLLSWFDAYHPTVDFFLSHTRKIARLVGYYQMIVPARIGRIVKEAEWFLLYNEHGRVVGRANHIIIAVGHGGLILPQSVQAYRDQHGRDDIVVHSFEEKNYAPPRRVLVVGDGLTSGTECANALLAGSMVYVVSRQSGYRKQALNTPRHYFSRRGIVPYRLKNKMERVKELKTATRGTIKPYFMWMKLFKQAEKSGQLQYVQGELVSLQRGSDGTVTAAVRLDDGHAIKPLLVDQVIVATGFLPVSTNPLWRQLIQDYNIPLIDTYLAVREDFCIEQMSSPGSRAMVIGPAAAWALPSADSLGGMKIVAHHIADMLMGQENWHPKNIAQKFSSWVRLVVGNELI